MATSPELRGGSSSAEDTDILSSRLSYVAAGAVLGAGYGVLALAQGSAGGAGVYALAIPALMLVAGALIGLELHATRSWSRRGKWLTLARWVLAFVSSGAMLGSALLLLGTITFGVYYGILAFAALAGAGFGMEAAHQEWREKASEKELTGDFRLRVILVIVSVIAFILTFV